MKIRKAGARLSRVMAALVMATGGLAVDVLPHAAPAAASSSMANLNVGCYGDYCTGQDPEDTGCSADAVTVAYTPYRYGILELRWSNTCKTNWARINSSFTGSLEAQQTQQTTGHKQYFSRSNVSFAWTKMIYSPTLCVRAQVVSSSATTATACV